MNSELEKIKKNIKESLVDGEAEFALDRLHTLAIKTIRGYCINHSIKTSDENGKKYPLHNLAGMLVKYYEKLEMVSDFTKTSLKQTISLYEKFNNIRNNNSYAHDNQVLSNEESLYVINSVANMLNFLNFIETGESQLININLINEDDIFEYICLHYAVSTSEIAEYFNTSIEEIKKLLMRLYKVQLSIRPAFVDCNPYDNNCKWSRR